MADTNPPPIRIGLVLAGGGGKGAYQIGCWKALRAVGLTSFTVISGTSVGALNGALITMGDFDKALKVWTDLEPRRVLRATTLKKVLLTLPLIILLVIGTFLYHLTLLLLLGVIPAVVAVGGLLSLFLGYLGYRLPPLSPCGWAALVGAFVLLTSALGYFEIRLMQYPVGRPFVVKLLKRLSLVFGRWVSVGTASPLLDLIRSNVDAERIRHSSTTLFATISVIARYWDPYYPVFLTPDSEFPQASAPGPLPRTHDPSARDRPTLPIRRLHVNVTAVPGPYSGWMPEVINVTSLPTDEEIYRALLESARVPFAFEQGTWMDRVSTDGGIRDNTPILPVAKVGCDVIIVIYLNHRARPSAKDLQKHIDLRCRFDACRLMSEAQAADLYRRFWQKFDLVEPWSHVVLDPSQLLLVVPSQSLGRMTDFSGGARVLRLVDLGEADMYAALKRHPLLARYVRLCP